MRSFRTHVNTPAVLLLAVIAGMLAHRSVANLLLAPQGPAVIATVDLESVFNALHEWSQAEIDLQEIASELDAHAQAIRAEVEQLNEDLETVYVQGTDQYEEKLDEATMKAMRFQAMVEASKRKLGRLRSNRLRTTYQSVKDAAEAMAQANGYDIVFVDDSKVMLPSGPMNEADITREISARRMLYTNPQLDVTEDLVVWMNNAFKAAGP